MLRRFGGGDEKRGSGVFRSGAAAKEARGSLDVDKIASLTSRFLEGEVVAAYLEPTEESAAMGSLAPNPDLFDVSSIVVHWLGGSEGAMIAIPQSLGDLLTARHALVVSLRTPIWLAGMIAVPLRERVIDRRSLTSFCTGLALRLEVEDRRRRLRALEELDRRSRSTPAPLSALVALSQGRRRIG